MTESYRCACPKESAMKPCENAWHFQHFPSFLFTSAPYMAPLRSCCEGHSEFEKRMQNKNRKNKESKLMNTKLMTSDRPATAETRGPEVNEITRAIIAGEAVQMPVNRPQILARRMARWARRAAHA
jgi:hypothetical protein